MTNVTRLIIARHGNTFSAGDTPTRVGGKTDLSLVEKGLLQGRQLGQYLKQENYMPDVIFTSSLKRTIQTAEQVQLEMGTKLSLQQLDVFDEIDYGPDENKTEDIVIARLGEDALKAWDAEAIVPDGWKVDPEGIIKNWNIFAEKIAKDYAGKTALVVTSNGIARFAPYLTGDFNGFRAQYQIKISTGAMCVFEHDGMSSNWVCMQWGIKPKDHLNALS